MIKPHTAVPLENVSGVWCNDESNIYAHPVSTVVFAGPRMIAQLFDFRLNPSAAFFCIPLRAFRGLRISASRG